MQRRVLGDEHPDTLRSANNLAATLVRRAKYAEAEEMLQSSVLGSAHPHTLVTERWLEDMRSSMRAEQPMRTAGKAAARRTERAAVPALSLLNGAGGGGSERERGGGRAACDAGP